MAEKTLVLIDGHALVYRMFFALERTRMHTKEGIPTWAIYGFLKAIFDLLDKIEPEAIAVSFDSGRDTFRLREYAEYKANRQAMPDGLHNQIKLLCEVIKTLNIPIYTLKGYEADDIIGTIAKKAKELGHKTLILTGDRDSFQLVDREGFIKVLIPVKSELVEYDTDKVFERMGVYPEQIVDYKALSGDASDNIPGVKGIGEKTAAKLLEEFKTLENLYNNLDKVSSASQREKLINDKEMAEKSKFLAQICLDVPIDFDFEHTHLEMPNIEEFTDFLKKFQFRSFLDNLPRIIKALSGKTHEEKGELEGKKQQIEDSFQKEVQLGLFGALEKTESKVKSNCNIVTTEKELFELIDNLKKVESYSLDTETTGLDVLEADLVGISFGYRKDNKSIAFYIPLFHSEGVQLESGFVLEKLKPLLEEVVPKKFLQNAKYEINVLKKYGIKLDGVAIDTMLASYVRNPSDRHGLKQQASLYLDFTMKSIDELIGKGKNKVTMDKLSIKDVANYACDDAIATLELGYLYENLDEKQKFVLQSIEMPLEKVLADIEEAGVSINTEYLKELSVQLQKDLNNIEEKIFEVAGCRFNINSPKQVAEVLFDKMGLPSRGKTKTKEAFSTGAKILESLAKDYEIARLILEQRHICKLKSTYIDALPLLIAKDGRLHTNFNQTVTTTGRLSSTNPNLQNIPIRTEMGAKIRAAFVPKNKESVLLSADYSQIELRLLAHFSDDEALIEAFRNDLDIHTATASKVFGVSLEQVTKDMRRKAKAVNFGIIYGQTSYGLSEALGITPAEAKEFITKYFQTYPKVKKFADIAIRMAHEKGYAETLYGRKRYLREDLSSRNRLMREFAERAAINTPLQGTAADLIKLAMIKLQEKLENYESKMILQVHDELVLEVPKKELEEITKIVINCMELDQPLKVPLKIDVKYGPNWLESEEEEGIIY